MKREEKIRLLQNLQSGRAPLSTLLDTTQVDFSKLTKAEIEEALHAVGSIRQRIGIDSNNEADRTEQEAEVFSRIEHALKTRPSNYGNHADKTQPFEGISYETLHFAKWGKMPDQKIS